MSSSQQWPLFKDVGKNANDLLKKGFPSQEKYAFRVEFDTTSNSGIQFQPYLQETLTKSVEGELKSKVNYKTLTFTTTGNLKEDVSLEISPTKPNMFKWTVNVNSNMSDFVDRLKGKSTLEARSDYQTSALTAEWAFRQSGKTEDAPKINVSSVFGSKSNGIALGLDAEISPSAQELKSFNTAFSYSKGDLDLALFSKTKIGGATTVSASYFQKYPYIGDDILFAAELACELNKKPTIALGAQFKPTSDSTAKARFDSKGLLGISYTEKWKGPLSVTLASDWNVLGGEGNAPFQYGIKLFFK